MLQSPYIDLDEERRRVAFLKKRERLASLASFLIGVLGSAVIGAVVLQLSFLGMLGALERFGKFGLLCAMVSGGVAAWLLIRGLMRLFLDRWEIALRCWFRGSLRCERLASEQKERGF